MLFASMILGQCIFSTEINRINELLDVPTVGTLDRRDVTHVLWKTGRISYVKDRVRLANVLSAFNTLHLRFSRGPGLFRPNNTG